MGFERRLVKGGAPERWNRASGAHPQRGRSLTSFAESLSANYVGLGLKSRPLGS